MVSAIERYVPDNDPLAFKQRYSPTQEREAVVSRTTLAGQSIIPLATPRRTISLTKKQIVTIFKELTYFGELTNNKQAEIALLFLQRVVKDPAPEFLHLTTEPSEIKSLLCEDGATLVDLLELAAKNDLSECLLLLADTLVRGPKYQYLLNFLEKAFKTKQADVALRVLQKISESIAKPPKASWNDIILGNLLESAAKNGLPQCVSLLANEMIHSPYSSITVPNFLKNTFDNKQPDIAFLILQKILEEHEKKPLSWWNNSTIGELLESAIKNDLSKCVSLLANELLKSDVSDRKCIFKLLLYFYDKKDLSFVHTIENKRTIEGGSLWNLQLKKEACVYASSLNRDDFCAELQKDHEFDMWVKKNKNNLEWRLYLEHAQGHLCSGPATILPPKKTAPGKSPTPPSEEPTLRAAPKAKKFVGVALTAAFANATKKEFPTLVAEVEGPTPLNPSCAPYTGRGFYRELR